MSENGIRSARGISAKADLPAGLGPKPAGPTGAEGPTGPNESVRRVRHRAQDRSKLDLKENVLIVISFSVVDLLRQKRYVTGVPIPWRYREERSTLPMPSFFVVGYLKKFSYQVMATTLSCWSLLMFASTSDDRLLITYRSPQLMTRGFSNQAQLMKHLFQGWNEKGGNNYFNFHYKPSYTDKNS